MSLTNQLVPISFHLRQFNKYVKLDLKASEAGNITFIGENAVGKTTLANCFFPMLIDGSISTPSFNPAKGVDKLAQNINPRNSARDTRNFESMLLGWGANAMKVRTGYSYLHLRSSRRQVILGIGATRISGDSKKPTWWFIVNCTDIDNELNIITTDDQGYGLNKDDFIHANKHLNEQLVVFDTATDYREYAATKIYGFSDGETLGRLASVYRLLASPILTAGNARFTPIRDSLKNAQEGIDPDLINQVANSQREVNRMNAVLQHLQNGQKRLKKIKTEIFWRNLNHLKEVLLDPYSEQYRDFSSEEIKVEAAKKKINLLYDQKQIISDQLLTQSEKLDQLRFKKAEQQSNKQSSQNISEQIKIYRQQLNIYNEQSVQLSKLNRTLEDIYAQLDRLKKEASEINNSQLTPFKDQLKKLTNQNLATLDKLLDTENLKEFSSYLSTYTKQIIEANVKYKSISKTISTVVNDVSVVNDMKNQMNEKIDERLQGPLSGRSHSRLVQDNQMIHEEGAAKINSQIQDLSEQQKGILFKNPDLSVMLQRPDILESLITANKQLNDILNNLDINKKNQEKNEQKRDYLINQIEELSHQMFHDFDPSLTEKKIHELEDKSKNILDDLDVDSQLIDARDQYEELNNEHQNIIQKISKNEIEMNAAQLQMNRLKQKLTVLNAVIELDLKNLKPYFPEQIRLENVDDLLNFSKENRIQIKNSNYADLSSTISQLIHHNDQNGIDRYALDTIFEERGQVEIASAMRQQRTKTKNDLTVVAFDIDQALQFLAADEVGVYKALRTLQTGNDISQKTYEAAAINRITEQYRLISEYNQILNQGTETTKSIKLKVKLTPSTVAQKVIDEARDPNLVERPSLQAEIQQRLRRLANNTDLADDDEAFNKQAQDLLDPRQWSNFQILIKRRQNNEDEYEEVDDKFVQSGGSGAEKAQAMVLPLLIVPKMLLQQAKLPDSPYLVMFDEFADKLDPETAKSFAQTISHFGFSFIATMPNGAQNKILADGVENIAYEVTTPTQTNDGKFYLNNVYPALIWQ